MKELPKLGQLLLSISASPLGAVTVGRIFKVYSVDWHEDPMQALYQYPGSVAVKNATVKIHDWKYENEFYSIDLDKLEYYFKLIEDPDEETLRVMGMLYR